MGRTGPARFPGGGLDPCRISVRTFVCRRGRRLVFPRLVEIYGIQSAVRGDGAPSILDYRGADRDDGARLARCLAVLCPQTGASGRTGPPARAPLQVPAQQVVLR